MKENVACTIKFIKLEALKSFQCFLAERTVLLALLSKKNREVNCCINLILSKQKIFYIDANKNIIRNNRPNLRAKHMNLTIQYMRSGLKAAMQ